MTVLEGALAVQPLSGRMSGFDEYFTNLTLNRETVNPWFREFWGEYHRCNLGGEGEAAGKVSIGVRRTSLLFTNKNLIN